jgi:hypothetical protein
MRMVACLSCPPPQILSVRSVPRQDGQSRRGAGNALLNTAVHSQFVPQDQAPHVYLDLTASYIALQRDFGGTSLEGSASVLKPIEP